MLEVDTRPQVQASTAVSLRRQALAVRDAERLSVGRQLQVHAGFGAFFIFAGLSSVSAEPRSVESVERRAAGEVQVYGGPPEQPRSAGVAVEELAHQRLPRLVFGTQRFSLVSKMRSFFLRDFDDLVEAVEQLVV